MTTCRCHTESAFVLAGRRFALLPVLLLALLFALVGAPMMAQDEPPAPAPEDLPTELPDASDVPVPKPGKRPVPGTVPKPAPKPVPGAGAEKGPASPSADGPGATPDTGDDYSPWTTEDVIDDRIDVAAQYSLMRMFMGDDMAAAMDASAILSAIKAQQLAGIYRADRGRPAQQARKGGGNYWEIVPKSFDAVCWREGGPTPMIVYRPGVDGVPERLDPALRQAWASCGLLPALPRPYIETIKKPPPPPPPPPPDLPPPGPSGLAVLVLSAGQPQAGVAVSVEPETGERLDGTTGGDGTARFEPAPGSVVVSVHPGSGYFPETRFLRIEPQKSYSITVELIRQGKSDPPPGEDPPPQDTCDTDKFHEVFNACGKKIWFKGATCTLSPHIAYWKCKGDPLCVSKAYAKFLACYAKSEYKEQAKACHDKANAESGCNIPMAPAP